MRYHGYNKKYFIYTNYPIYPSYENNKLTQISSDQIRLDQSVCSYNKKYDNIK